MRKKSENIEAPIIILDDDRAFRHLIASILTSAGYQVLEAERAKIADELLAAHNVSLLIVDQQMPGTDGKTFISGLRHLHVDLPIVYLSAKFCDQQDFKHLTDELKVNLVLQKPVVPELFLCQIEFLLAGKRSKATSEEPLPVADGDVLRKLFEPKDDREPVSLIERKPLLAPYVPVSSKKRKAREKLSAAARAVVERNKEITELSERVSQRPEKDEDEERILHEPEPDLLEELKLFREKLEIERLVQEARLDYARQLPSTIQALIADLESLRNSPDSQELYENVLVQAHRFRGTAGSMGFVQLGHAAGVLEDLLLSRQRTGADSQESTWQEIVEALRECERNCYSHVVDWSGAFAAAQSQPAAIRRPRGRILLVDDDQVLMRFVGGVLAGEGYVVQVLSEPVRVIDTALEFRPDLFLLDVVMPGLSGYDIARAVKAEKTLRKTPIVFLTARNSPIARKAAMRAGGDDFLAKPIFAEELKAKVRSVLQS